MAEQKNASFSWNALHGMTETAAEKFMLENWGRIPSDWNDPLFRD